MSRINDCWIIETETDDWGDITRLLEDLNGNRYIETVHEDGSYSFRCADE